MRKLRIAFVTNEYQRDSNASGGLGSYVNRMTKSLLEAGHEPEVFTWRNRRSLPYVEDNCGVRVEYCNFIKGRLFNGLRWLDRRYLHSPGTDVSLIVGGALGLARALERRHKERPFDLVQSTNCGASGLFVRHCRHRRHVVRMSSVREMVLEADGKLSMPGAKLLCWLEKLSTRSGDFVYAPSRFVKNSLQGLLGKPVGVVRPPFFLDVEPAPCPPFHLPEKYGVYFGSIGATKGSDVLARALPLVWKRAPDFKMVWAGKERYAGTYRRCEALWGERAKNVQWVKMIEKDALYAVVKRALFSVVPSRVDNFPNVVMESLLLGVPVVGSEGASIDEMVEHGVNGWLFPVGDATKLADRLVQVWDGRLNLPPQQLRKTSVLDEITPAAAVASFLRFAGVHERPCNV